MRRYTIIFILFACSLTSIAQPRTDNLLLDLFRTNTDSLFKSVIWNQDTFRYQIIYTQINRDKNNNPSFTNYYFNYDSLQYFNPASTVKMPLAFLALEKLSTLKDKDIDKFTPMQYDSGYSRQTVLYKDSTAENGLPSIAQFIRKAFLVSDNDAYNRLYEFVGQKQLNERLWAQG